MHWSWHHFHFEELRLRNSAMKTDLFIYTEGFIYVNLGLKRVTYFFYYFAIKQKSEMNPTLMCTFSVFHFMTLVTRSVLHWGRIDTGKEGFRFIVLELKN